MPKALRLYRITPKLYQSAKTHDLVAKQRIALINDYKLNAVINLWHTKDMDMEKAMHVKGGIYIHKYFPDGKAPVFKDMMLLADLVCDYIHEGKVVLTHCYGGRNRSGLLNAMVVMQLYGWDGTTAYEYIRECRPNSLVNKTFAAWLQQQGK